MCFTFAYQNSILRNRMNNLLDLNSIFVYVNYFEYIFIISIFKYYIL